MAEPPPGLCLAQRVSLDGDQSCEADTIFISVAAIRFWAGPRSPRRQRQRQAERRLFLPIDLMLFTWADAL